MNEINSQNPKIKTLEDYYKSKNPNTKNFNIKENPNNLLIYVLTFNMKGKTPTESDIPLLFPKDFNKFDLFIISTQECLRSIGVSMFVDSKEQWILFLQNFLGDNYIKIIESNLNAIHLCIFAKKEKSKHFHDLRSGEIKTGFLNLFGNKGAVSASMKYLDKYILFIGCHLAAGQDETNKRLENLLRISNSLSVSVNLEAKEKLKSHKMNLHKTFIQTKKVRNELNNDNINMNSDEFTFRNRISESQVLLSKKSNKLNEDNDDNNNINNNLKINDEEDKKDKGNNFIDLDNIKEVESIKGDEEEKNDNNNNLNILNKKSDKNAQAKKTDLFDKMESLNESVSSVISEEKKKDKKMEDYDFVIISGDLNYRLNLENKNNIKEIMKKNDPQILWDKDQLTEDIKQDNKLKEGIINFMPTYKYKENKEDYDYERIPGWTDRILFRSKKLYDIMLCEYNSIQNIFLSDHKPVYAIFKINFKNKKDFEEDLKIKDDNDKECNIF